MARKIGRYEVLGELATGGMAEILLARLVGAAGFERPVVLKQIRDRSTDGSESSASDAELTTMFHEEARLLARIRHANVVHVEDLGIEDDRPFLVMEYLEGESVANVTRRLVARGETLSLSLAAFIVAEACAGLHAAHELVDDDGKPLGVIHRDVSPQNVFATYQGQVKVLDFGIAHIEGAPSSERGTSDGRLMGKYAYMAPEQLRREPLDRRTDVFALGVLFYELLTGRRLFKRFTPNATMIAVTNEPILPPSRVCPAVTPALEKVCMRALSRDRNARYASTGEMRKELLVAMRSLAEKDDNEEPAAELAALMQRCFADRMKDKRELLRTVRAGSIVDHVPAGDVDVTIEIPIIEEATLTMPAAPPDSMSVEVYPPVTTVGDRREATTSSSFFTKRSPRIAAAALLVVVLGLGGLGMWWRRARASAMTPIPPVAAAANEAAAVVPSTASVAIDPPPSTPTSSASSSVVVGSGPAPLPASHRSRSAPRKSAPLAPTASAPPIVRELVDEPAPASPPQPSSSSRGFRRWQ
jgi:eukaryotic-like serine/threonine-protein kinase